MKRLMIAVFLSMFIANINAQLSYGAKAGLNIARIGFTDDDFTTKSKPGLTGGIFANYELATKASLQLELLYSGEGTKERRISNNAIGKISKTYLQLPLLFQYTITHRFYAEAGPQIGFLISSKEKYNGNKKDIKQYYKSTDLRLPIGIGYRFNNKFRDFAAAARYSFSFSRINKEAVGGGDLKNKVLSIAVQYTIPN